MNPSVFGGQGGEMLLQTYHLDLKVRQQKILRNINKSTYFRGTYVCRHNTFSIEGDKK